jgi:hypothetical protein
MVLRSGISFVFIFSLKVGMQYKNLHVSRSVVDSLPLVDDYIKPVIVLRIYMCECSAVTSAFCCRLCVLKFTFSLHHTRLHQLDVISTSCTSINA